MCTGGKAFEKTVSLPIERNDLKPSPYDEKEITHHYCRCFQY